jgi:hypothetical protein
MPLTETVTLPYPAWMGAAERRAFHRLRKVQGAAE